MKVLFVGLNPSRSSPTKEPMHPSTKSRQILNSWIKGLDIEPVFINLVDEPTENNRPLKLKEIKQNYESIATKTKEAGCGAVIAMGSTVSKILSDLNITHVQIPHPSTRNRVLNDQLKVKEVIDRLADLFGKR